MSLHLPSPAPLLAGGARGGTGMAWVPSGHPGEPPKYLGRSWQCWWDSWLWSLRVAGPVGDAAAQVLELAN